MSEQHQPEVVLAQLGTRSVLYCKVWLCAPYYLILSFCVGMRNGQLMRMQIAAVRHKRDDETEERSKQTIHVTCCTCSVTDTCIVALSSGGTPTTVIQLHDTYIAFA